MNTREYVDNLFDNYADTQDLRDFKLEITANLDDRVSDLKKSGLPDGEAFKKAVSELGDITEIADDISRQKRNEVIDKMYVHQKVKISAKRALAYVIAGGILAFGVIVALMTGFMSADFDFGYRGSAGLMTAIPFVTVAAFMFTYLGLTQETAANYPMKSKRAVWYSLAVAVAVFGIATAAGSAGLRYMSEHQSFSMVSALGVLIPFLIPSAGLLVFLVLTEKPRHKPWVAENIEKSTAAYAERFSGREGEKFGIGSGILWTFSFAVFITLGIIFGFQYAWLVFLFSIVGEMVLLYKMLGNK